MRIRTGDTVLVIAGKERARPAAWNGSPRK